MNSPDPFPCVREESPEFNAVAPSVADVAAFLRASASTLECLPLDVPLSRGPARDQLQYLVGVVRGLVDSSQALEVREAAHGVSLKVAQVGNSLGVILPKEVLSHMKVGKGDALHVLETTDGIRLTPHDPRFAHQMDAARAVMRKRRDVLRELAK